MKVGVLFSGGKDSCLALQKALGFHDVVCLISMIPESEESYMFHTPNIKITKQQAEAIGLPSVQRRTRGEKEKELGDLEKVLIRARSEFELEGVVTGAVRSIYQSSRVQRVCRKLGLWCFNPLWLKDEIELLNEVVENGFEVIITGVFAYPLGKEYLGRRLDAGLIRELERLNEEYGINPAGEGGEIETTVTDAPFFKKKIEILSSNTSYKDYAGTFTIKELRLTEK